MRRFRAEEVWARWEKSFEACLKAGARRFPRCWHWTFGDCAAWSPPTVASRRGRVTRCAIVAAGPATLAIGAPVAIGEHVRDSVPLWFHTFALAPGVYTPGVARDHGYRFAVLGADRFAGRSVLDVGAFDGFYSFLAEARGARRVVAVDNEQYVDWVRARFGITVEGGAGFRAIAELVGSRVQYRRMDALDLHELAERFDVVLCFGILHRVTDPIRLLRALMDVLAAGGEIVLETYGSSLPAYGPAIEVH